MRLKRASGQRFSSLKDGSTRNKVVAHPRGTGGQVLTNADIVGKYRSLTHSVISPDRQSAIEKIVLNLEGLNDGEQQEEWWGVCGLNCCTRWKLPIKTGAYNTQPAVDSNRQCNQIGVQ